MTQAHERIGVRHVSKVFGSAGSETVALHDVSVSIESGKTTVLIGPSGCGKSTLLNVLAGLDHVSDGEIEFSGGSPGRGVVVMMFQRSSLLPWRNVLQNVMLSADLLGLDHADSVGRARELLDLVGLGGWHEHYPSQLSGGMQQRVALARVLLPDPDVLLLDEPFGALDEMTREALDIEMCRIIESTGKTMVMVTHSIYEAILIADRVVVLSAHPGQVVETIDVGLAHPRRPSVSTSSEFTDLVSDVRRALYAGGTAL